MGGETDRLSVAEAASGMRWWLEAGVDVALQEDPRNWLAAPARSRQAPEAPPAGADSPLPSSAAFPDTIAAFRQWLAEAPALPLARPGAARVLPAGPDVAATMLVADAPTAEEERAGAPVAGEAAVLLERMLAAIGVSPEQAYTAPLACFYAPGPRLNEADLAACAEIVRHQVRLLKPRHLLLLGPGPARALLGKPLPSARGHVHKVEGVRTVASFHPRHLLRQTSDKALAWRDLLLLTEEDQ